MMQQIWSLGSSRGLAGTAAGSVAVALSRVACSCCGSLGGEALLHGGQWQGTTEQAAGDAARWQQQFHCSASGSPGPDASSSGGSSSSNLSSSGRHTHWGANIMRVADHEGPLRYSNGSSSSSSSSSRRSCHAHSHAFPHNSSSTPYFCSPFSTRAYHGSPLLSAGHAATYERSPEEEQTAAAAAAAAAVAAAANGSVDPFSLVSDEVQAVSERLRHSVVSNVPALKAAADYYFRPGVQGKRLRPTLLLLLASAISGRPGGANWAVPDLRPPDEPPAEPRRRAQRIAEIAETIHVASLLHDDVLDDASTRRGVLSLNASAGNKLAILAGDFLLARASVTLASLRNHEVTELMSRVLENLVSGEVMQMTAGDEQLDSLDHYMHKTFCKTASLMANSARCVALLADAPPEACTAAWEYGRHLGLAFQIVDDILDITGSSSILGKPALNDMKAGLATAPVLLAAREQPALVPLIRRKFRGAGDVGAAVELVRAGRGVEAARALAAEHAALAAAQVRALPPRACEHAALCSNALVRITEKVLTRSK